jgi:hypothetical protein
MANEAARLQITLLTNAELVRFPYSLLSFFDFLRARIRPTAFNVAAMPHKVAMVHPNRARLGSGEVAPTYTLQMQAAAKTNTESSRNFTLYRGR